MELAEFGEDGSMGGKGRQRGVKAQVVPINGLE